MGRGVGRAVATVVATGLVGVGALTGCSSGDGGGTPAAKPTASGTPAPPEVSTAASVDSVTGQLDPSTRDAVTAAVTEVVDGWIDQAYLGDFPRSDFAAAFAGFTEGAAAQAQRSLDLMSNADVSDRIEKAEASARTVSLDVLAVKQKPVGVTATVDLTFVTTGSLAGTQRVTGTLDLTPAGSGWQVFGFDIAKTPAAGASPTASPTASPSEETAG